MWYRTRPLIFLLKQNGVYFRCVVILAENEISAYLRQTLDKCSFSNPTITDEGDGHVVFDLMVEARILHLCQVRAFSVDLLSIVF